MRLTGKRVRNQPESLFPSSLASILLFSSVAQSCPTLCDPVDCSTPGLPVHQQLPELAQTHVHRVGDAIQPSRPLLSPSPPTFHLSQHRGLLLPVQSASWFSLHPISILIHIPHPGQAASWFYPFALPKPSLGVVYVGLRL